MKPKPARLSNLLGTYNNKGFVIQTAGKECVLIRVAVTGTRLSAIQKECAFQGKAHAKVRRVKWCGMHFDPKMKM